VRAASPGAIEPRRLKLRIRETQEAADDSNLLDDVRRVLLDYRGADAVMLEIATEGRIVTLEWPMVRVNASAELEQRLADLLGAAGRLSVEIVAQ
jgi:hypothetical protein